MFNRMVRTAAAAGLLAGLMLTGVQHLQVTRIIAQAEVLESAGEAQPAAHTHADGAQHVHEGAHEAAHGAAHEEPHEAPHEHGGWQPEDGVERTLYTALADVSMAVGYGLLLAAAIGLRGRAVDWRSGLLWGAAGYAVFFLAPSVGLPPELPGTAAAPVAARQGWWIATAMSTATALAMLAFGRHWALKLAAVALLVVPHLVGAPQPLVHASVAPEHLQRSFVYATALANGVFWLALGALTGLFHQRFADR
ncbi:cobalt transporter subunit CbtA [Duganella sp. CF517]|uniref:CbtA family protein n=1 Tax=Duganella sp. CF517 TaxID=1881038 RepID=UPI0008AEEBD9|nr:CbtA family protein [Duganella sp. CF517]SEN77681.1 cobalt transporter subunit CbtA [Duganella sp. CF517]